MTRTGGINAVSSSMTTRNKYVKRSRISEKKFRQLVKLFSLDLDAIQISELSHLNQNTVNRYLKAIHNRIAQFCEVESPVKGEVEIDESYFGAKRVKGKRGRGASGKTIVFGIFQRNGRVYTEIVLMLDGKHFRISYVGVRFGNCYSFRWLAWIHWIG